MTKAHGIYVIGGVRGTYSAVYAFSRQMIPASARDEHGSSTGNLPENPDENMFVRRLQVSRFNSLPEFRDISGETNPASRIFYTKLHVYPNPSSGLLQIGGNYGPGSMIRITDFAGRLAWQHEVQAGERLIEADLGNAVKGMYNVTVVTAGGSAMSKQVVIE